MKMKYRFVIVLLTVGLFSASCDNFLEQSAQDLVIPRNVTQYKELLQGEGYFKQLSQYYQFVHFMTDNVEYWDGRDQFPKKDGAANALEVYEECYKWAKEIENDQLTDGLYKYLYTQVLTANSCLEGIEGAEGTEAERKVVRGQAYFTRAFAYFMLANFYGQAYNEAKPDDLCVPLHMTATPSTGTYQRATIREVWQQIRSDVEQAVNDLKGSDIVNIYEISYKAALVLATRIALYMEDYEAVKKYGEEFLTVHDVLLDITDKTDAGSDGGDKVTAFLSSQNPEMVWMFCKNANYPYRLLTLSFNEVEGFRVSMENTAATSALIHLYDTDVTALTGDRRLLYWFVLPDPTGKNALDACYNTLKYNKYTPDNGLQFGLHTSEVYLSLAEAYARQQQPDAAKAIAYLNGLREKRIAPYTALTSADFPTAQSLIDFVWEERRRELCFEEQHRWWDMRRTGQQEVIHHWASGETYRLAHKDPAYVLNFPLAEREYDRGLIVNSRPDRLAE